MAGFFDGTGFHQCSEDRCIFIPGKLIVFFFVDDIVGLYLKGREKEWDKVHESLTTAFKVKDLGELHWFLGIEIIRDREKKELWLSQASYMAQAANKLIKHRLDNLGKQPMVPLARETLYPFDQVSEEVDKLYYASIVGHLLYPSIMTRLDIAFAATKLSQFSYNPSKQHIVAAEACL